MLFWRKRYRLDRMISSLLQFFDVAACDAINLHIGKKISPNFKSLRSLSPSQTYLQLFDQKWTKVFFFFNYRTRNRTIGNALCHFFARFHLLQISSAKSWKNGLLSRKKLKQNQIYCERDGIRLTLNLAQTNAVKIILNCLCNTDTVFMYEQDSCVK